MPVGYSKWPMSIGRPGRLTSGRGVKKAQGAIALPPRVADPRVLVEQLEADASFSESLADDESGRSCADDRSVERGCRGHDDLLHGLMLDDATDAVHPTASAEMTNSGVTGAIRAGCRGRGQHLGNAVDVPDAA